MMVCRYLVKRMEFKSRTLCVSRASFFTLKTLLVNQKIGLDSIYNKHAFHEAELDPKKPPLTYSELKEAEKKLTKKETKQCNTDFQC